MKNRIRIIAVAVAFVMVGFLFASCSPKTADNDIVMTVDGVNITAGEYLHNLRVIKDQMKQTDPDRAEEEFWRLPCSEDKSYTNRDYAEKTAKERCIYRVLVNKKFKEMNLKLSQDYQDSINQYVDMYAQDYGSKSDFVKALKKAGLSEEIFTDMQFIGAKVQTIMDALYGPGKPQEIKQAELQQCFLQNYVRIKHVLIKTSDSSGKALSSDKLTDAKNRANDILARANAGEDFDKMSLELSEDAGSKSYPDGYTFSQSETQYPAEFITAAFEMKVGEIKMIETSMGYSIMKKYPVDNPATLFDVKRDDVYDFLSTKKFNDLFNSWAKQLTVATTENYDELNKLFYLIKSDTGTETPTPTTSK